MSRFPIVRVDHIYLSRNYSDEEDAHNRVCLGAVINTPKVLVLVREIQ
jgi:hypothetical protein